MNKIEIHSQFQPEQPLSPSEIQQAIDELLSAAPGEVEKKYVVLLRVSPKTIYLYRLFGCDSHFAACTLAIQEHSKRHSITPGLECRVSGICQDSNCDCGGGKTRVITWVVPA